jgi:N-acetyl-1-D-myo-inositol-2-amino-2-deoxy-alpha-D-glucopyranoside deacetylase
MGELGVTEWENLGYRDSGMMGDPGNRDPRNYWQANLDEAIGRLVWFVRKVQPDVMTTYNDFGGYGHPDHIRTHLVAVGAFERAGDSTAYPEQLGDGIEPWAPSKLYEQAFSISQREAMNERMKELGRSSFWMPPEDATPEQLAEYEAFMARATVAEEKITTRIDVSAQLDQKWAAIGRHVTQISMESPFMLMGLEGWREFWATESYVLRESRIRASAPETDLFAGL